MGAAWLQETRIIPLIDKRMAGTKVGVVLEPKQYLALNDSDKLDDLHDIIPKDLDIPKTAATFWNSGKKKFMKVLEIYFDP
jgi:hypothetical protein